MTGVLETGKEQLYSFDEFKQKFFPNIDIKICDLQLTEDTLLNVIDRIYNKGTQELENVSCREKK
jgi:hypothetical protein